MSNKQPANKNLNETNNSSKKLVNNQLLLPNVYMNKKVEVNHLLLATRNQSSQKQTHQLFRIEKSRSLQKFCPSIINQDVTKQQLGQTFNSNSQTQHPKKRRFTLIDRRNVNEMKQVRQIDKKQLQRSRMLKALKINDNKLQQKQKEKLLFAGNEGKKISNPYAVLTPSSMNENHRRYHSEQKQVQKSFSIQKPNESANKKHKGFGRIKVKSLTSLTNNQNEHVQQKETVNNDNAQQQTGGFKGKGHKQLKLNVRKQLSLLKIPDSRKPLKITKPQQLRSIVPRQGYQYIQNPFQKQISFIPPQQPSQHLFYTPKQFQFIQNKQIQTTVSRNGVMVKEFNQTKFYTTKEYENYLKKIQKLRAIEFFRNFLSIKCFKRWKIYVFSQRFAVIRNIMKQSLKNIYSEEFIQIRKIFDRIAGYKYIQISREQPLELEKYLVYLHDTSFPVIKRITEEHYLQVVELMIRPIKDKIKGLQVMNQNRQQMLTMYQRQYRMTKKGKFIQQTSQLSQQFQQNKSIVSSFNKTFQFKNEFLFIQGFLKKIFYNFTTYHIEWTRSIYSEILTKLKVPLQNYKKNRQNLLGGLSNLFNLKNKEEFKYEKLNEISDMEMRLVEYVCRFVTIENAQGDEIGKQSHVSKSTPTQKLSISLTSSKIITSFQQFAQHLTNRLAPNNILYYYRTYYQREYRMGRTVTQLPQQQQIYLQIIQSVIEKMDTYTSEKILSYISGEGNDEHEIFRCQLKQIMQDNVSQCHTIIEILNTLINDVMEYFHSQDRKQSYILSYTIMQQTRQKIALIPDDIHVGLFVINILEVKSYLKDFINHQIEELTKDLPEEFRLTYNAFYQKLLNFTTKINLSVWTIEDFVTSFQYKQIYEDYRQQEIFKDQEKIKNILSAVNKTLPKTYEQCYVLFLKLKDMIQKIQTRVQTFDLNCIKKLKFFSRQIEDLAENIWKELVRVRNRILELDTYVERETFIQEILTKLPEFQQQLKTIKKSIERLSYIQTLQIRFNLKEKLTKDFNLYQKSQSDLKLLQSLLKKLLIFQKQYSLQLSLPITLINGQSLLQEINTNKSQIKISQRYIISYQKILTKIYQLYDYYKIVLETADELGRLDRGEVCEVLKVVVEKEKEKDKIGQWNLQQGEKIKVSRKKTYRPAQVQLHALKQSSTSSQTLSPTSANFITEVHSLISSLQYYRKQALTLQQTISSHLYTKYDEIHYEILKKQKKKKMQIIIKNIETDMNNIILEVCNLQRSPFTNSTDDNIFSSLNISNMQFGSSAFDDHIGSGIRQRNSSIGKKDENFNNKRNRSNSINSIKSIEDSSHELVNLPVVQKQKHQINLHSGFVNLKHSIKVIDEILNQLKNIILSPFLQDEKHLLLQKIEYVGSNLQILNLLYQAQTKVQKLIEDNILTDAMKEIEKDWSSHHNLFQNKLSSKRTKQISFDSKLQKDVINAWYLLLRRLSNKKVSQISLCFKQQSNDLDHFMSRLGSFQRIVNIKIHQKKTLFPLLYFYTNSQILKFVLMPQQFVHHIYPSVYHIQRKDKRRFGMSTIYGQELELQLGQQQQGLTVRGIYQEMRIAIGGMFKANLQRKPIQLWNTHYLKQKIPMQIVYVLDQLYLAQRYISSHNLMTSPHTKQLALTNIMQEIKNLSKQLNQSIELELMDYKHLLGEMLINSRVDYRHRVEANFAENCWLNQLLVYYMDSHDQLYYKNLSHQMPIKFQLVNAMDLVALFPGSEKTFVKMCEAFTGEMSAIHIKQSDILKTLSARLMYLFIQHDFSHKISDDICRGVVYNFPICFLAKFQNISYEVISKLIRCIEKVRHEVLRQRMNKGSLLQGTSYFSNAGDSTCIFLSFARRLSNDEIPYKLRAMFRSLTPSTPCYQLVFLSKLLRADLDPSSVQIIDSLYIVNGYFNLYRQTLAQSPSFSFVNRLLSRLVKQLLNKKQAQYKQTIREFFVEYFVNIGMDRPSIQNFLNRSSAAEQASNILSTSHKQNRSGKGITKKFDMLFRFLIDPHVKKQSHDKSSFMTNLINTTGNKLALSTYEIKQKVDTFIQSIRQTNKNVLPQIMLTRLEQIIRIIINSSNEKPKPIFLFGNYRSGKTFLIKQLISFFTKIYYRNDVLIETVHQSEISTTFTRLKDKSKRIALLKMFLQGTSQTSNKYKQALMFLQVSSVSNQNGLLETFLNMFDQQACTNSKQLSKIYHHNNSKSKQSSIMNDFTYVMEIKKMVAISPNIFLNTYKFYLPEHLSTIQYMTKKWSREFLSKFDIKEKDDNYYVVVNGHNLGFKLVQKVFETISNSGTGIEWIVQPIYENIVTTVLKWLDTFLVDITDVDALFRFEDRQYLIVASGKNIDNISSEKTIKSNNNQKQKQQATQSKDFVAQLTQPKQRQQLFLKIVAYCAFWTLILSAQYNSYSIIEKIVKQQYYRMVPEVIKTRQNFLYKILVIQGGQATFKFITSVNNPFLIDELPQTSIENYLCHQVPPSLSTLIIENQQMRVFNYFVNKLKSYTFSNPESRMSNNLLIIGRQEVGKSAWVRNFVLRENQNMFIRVKSHDHKWMQRLIFSIVDYKNQRPKNTSKLSPRESAHFLPTTRTSSLTPQQNILIWVDNVFFYQQTSQLQRYMKFLSQHKQYRHKNLQNGSIFITKQIKSLVYFTQRRYIEKQYLYENWNLTVISVPFLEHEMQTIFAHVIMNKLAMNFIDEGVMQKLRTTIHPMANHHLTLLKFCRQTTKPSLFNWTIDISYGKYHNIIDEYFSNTRLFNAFNIQSPQQFKKRLNISLFFTLFCCMRSRKDIEMFENRVSKFLDLNYREVQGYMMDQEAQGKDNNSGSVSLMGSAYVNSRQNDKLHSVGNNEKQKYLPLQSSNDPNTAIARLSLKLKQNRYFKNILIYPTFCKNFQIVSYALRNKRHLLVNKKYISREFSFIEMVLEIQGKEWGKLDLVRSYWELKQMVGKLAENEVQGRRVSQHHQEDDNDGGKSNANVNQQASSNIKKPTKPPYTHKNKHFPQSGTTTLYNKQFYLYVPYQIIKLNPSILQYIVQYIQSQKSQKTGQQNEQNPQYINKRVNNKDSSCLLANNNNNNKSSTSLPNNNVTFIIQYSLHELQMVSNYLLTSLPKTCTVIKLQSPQLTEYEQIGIDILSKKYPQQQLQLLKSISKTLYTVFSDIHDQQLTDISYEKNKFIHQYNYNIRNYAQFVKIVADVYFKRLRFAQLKKNSLQLTLSQIDKLVREYKLLKCDQNQYSINKKLTISQIDANTVWLKSARKKIQYMKLYSVQKGIMKYKQNIESIDQQITKIKQNQRKLARTSKHLSTMISRNELAQMKYIFINNFTSMRLLFQCVCLILGDEIDYASMKKCFTDLNLLNRLKDVTLQTVPFMTVLLIKQRIDEMLMQMRSFSTIGNKTIFEWLRSSVELLITRNQMRTKLPLLVQERQALEQELDRLIETNQIDSLQTEMNQRQQQLIKDQLQLKQLQQKLYHMNTLLTQLDRFEEFFQLKRHCEDEVKSLQQIVKDFLYYSILEGVELVYFNIYNEHQKKRVRTVFGNFMKRRFGFLATKDKQQVFDKFEEINSKDDVPVERSSSKKASNASMTNSNKPPTSQNSKQTFTYSTITPILQPKHQYSTQITRSFQYMNKILLHNKQTLLIVDPYNTFVNTIKLSSKVLIMQLRKFMKKKLNYAEYKLLILQLQDDEWNVSLKQLAKNSKNQRKILEYRKVRIMLPSELNVIFIKRSFCSSTNSRLRNGYNNKTSSYENNNTNKRSPTTTTGRRNTSSSPLKHNNNNNNDAFQNFNNNIEDHYQHNSHNNNNDNIFTHNNYSSSSLSSPYYSHHPQPFNQLMFTFRIFNFEFSEADYYLLIKMIIIEQLIKAKQHSSLEMIVNKQQVIRKSFMSVLYFFCRKTNQFALKNTQLVRQAIAMIEMWKITLIQTRGFQYEVFEQKHQKQEIKKIYRILSKMFKLIQMYFSQSNQHLNFDYFVSTLTRGAIYGIYNFGDEKYFILQYVISMIVYSLKSRNQFLSMFFMKIYSIEESICTQMQSDNLTFVMEEVDRLQGFVVEKIQKGTYNYFKHLPFQNKHLQNCYSKILALQKSQNNTLTHEQINQIIQQFDNLSFFKKLVIKRILTPPIFQQQMIESIQILSEIIIKNNDNFIKKFFRNGLLYCQCDIYYWKKNIKLKFKYQEVVLSEIHKVKEMGSRANVLVIDDMEGEYGGGLLGNGMLSTVMNSGGNNNSNNTTQITSSTRSPTQTHLRRDEYIRILVSLEHENSIFFSHLPLKEQHNKYFKSIPFLLFLELYCFVNIDTHEKDWGKDRQKQKQREKQKRESKIVGNGQGSPNYNQQSPKIQEQNSPPPNPKFNLHHTTSLNSSSHPIQSPNHQPHLFHRIFTNKQIKRHYYSIIASKSTQQRSIAIIRFSNHIPFLLKHEKNQSKILTYYYWKFLVWYENQQKIVFESIKQKIMKKDNSLAMKLQHYQHNSDILKAINIMAPQKVRSQNDQILRIFKQHYAVILTYLSKQPKIEYYESDVQRNVFVNEAVQYEKTVSQMLGYVREVGNVLLGKVGVDPQRVRNYFQKKRMFSLHVMNECLNNLALHRQQVNDQKTLTHLNIELIKSPANLIALFSKPAYKILILQKHGNKGTQKTQNFLKGKQEFLQSTPSIKTIQQDKEDIISQTSHVKVKQQTLGMKLKMKKTSQELIIKDNNNNNNNNNSSSINTKQKHKNNNNNHNTTPNKRPITPARIKTHNKLLLSEQKPIITSKNSLKLIIQSTTTNKQQQSSKKELKLKLGTKKDITKKDISNANISNNTINNIKQREFLGRKILKHTSINSGQNKKLSSPHFNQNNNKQIHYDHDQDYDDYMKQQGQQHQRQQQVQKIERIASGGKIKKKQVKFVNSNDDSDEIHSIEKIVGQKQHDYQDHKQQQQQQMINELLNKNKKNSNSSNDDNNNNGNNNTSKNNNNTSNPTSSKKSLTKLSQKMLSIQVDKKLEQQRGNLFLQEVNNDDKKDSNLKKVDRVLFDGENNYDNSNGDGDVIAKIFAKFLNVNNNNFNNNVNNNNTTHQQTTPNPDTNILSISNITMTKTRRPKRPILHKIYIYNQYRILFKPLQKKQLQKINATQMFRLKLFQGFQLKLHYDKQQLARNSTSSQGNNDSNKQRTQQNFTTFNSFSIGDGTQNNMLMTMNNGGGHNSTIQVRRGRLLESENQLMLTSVAVGNNNNNISGNRRGHRLSAQMQGLLDRVRQQEQSSILSYMQHHNDRESQKLIDNNISSQHSIHFSTTKIRQSFIFEDKNKKSIKKLRLSGENRESIMGGLFGSMLSVENNNGNKSNKKIEENEDRMEQYQFQE